MAQTDVNPTAATTDAAAQRPSLLPIVGTASKTVAIDLVGTILGIVQGIVLARVLLSHGLGTYVYALAWVDMACLVGVMGYRPLVLRMAASYRASGDCGRLRGLMRQSQRHIAAGSLAITAVLAAALWALGGGLEPAVRDAFWIAILIVPIRTLTSIQQARLTAFQEVVRNRIIGRILVPMLTITLVMAAALLASRILLPAEAVAIHLFIAIIVATLFHLLVRRTRSSEERSADPVYERQSWMRSAAHYLTLSLVQVPFQRTPLLLLGFFHGATPVALLSVAAKGAEMTNLGVFAVEPILSSTVAHHHASEARDELQRAIDTSRRFALVVASAVAAAIVAFGWFILRLYGPDFTQAYTILCILTAANLIGVGFGSVGQLLLMTGYQTEILWARVTSGLVALVVALVLIPPWSYTGAAIAAGTSNVLWNALLAWRAKRVLGIDSSVLTRWVRPHEPGG